MQAFYPTFTLDNFSFLFQHGDLVQARFILQQTARLPDETARREALCSPIFSSFARYKTFRKKVGSREWLSSCTPRRRGYVLCCSQYGLLQTGTRSWASPHAPDIGAAIPVLRQRPLVGSKTRCALARKTGRRIYLSSYVDWKRRRAPRNQERAFSYEEQVSQLSSETRNEVRTGQSCPAEVTGGCPSGRRNLLSRFYVSSHSKGSTVDS